MIVVVSCLVTVYDQMFSSVLTKMHFDHSVTFNQSIFLPTNSLKNIISKDSIKISNLKGDIL